MKRSDFRFIYRLRVRWAKIDMQKIVFNGHYLMYFDTAVGDYWRHLVLPYEQTMHDLGGDLYVVKSTLEYKASAVYDELLHIGRGKLFASDFLGDNFEFWITNGCDWENSHSAYSVTTAWIALRSPPTTSLNSVCR